MIEKIKRVDTCANLTAAHIKSTVKQYIKEATIESTNHKKSLVLCNI